MKRRYCMTLDRELMQKVDRLIDGSKLRNRSQTVQQLIEVGISHYRMERTAVILCGGLGMKLRPLTFVTPKPMLPIGYTPLLEYQINYLKRFEFERIILAVGYLQEQVVKYFSDGQRLGVKILYSYEKEPLDTGGAIKNTESLVTSDFLALNGDVVFDSLDLNRLMDHHKSTGSVATVVLSRKVDATRFGVVDMSPDGKITKFVEKPRRPTIGKGWINAGVYVFSPAVFGYVKPRRSASLEKDVFPRLAAERRASGFLYEGYWTDIGTQDDYMQVCRDILTGTLKPTVLP